MTADNLAVIRRMPDDAMPLTAIEDADPLAAIDLHLRHLHKLQQRELSPSHRELVDLKISGALFRKALISAQPHRRTGLIEAAKQHPNQLRGWAKSSLAMLLGNRMDPMLGLSRKKISRAVSS